MDCRAKRQRFANLRDQSPVSLAVLLEFLTAGPINGKRPDEHQERRQPSCTTPNTFLFVQVGLSFILIRLVFDTYTAFDPDERESSPYHRVSAFVASLSSLCLQSLP